MGRKIPGKKHRGIKDPHKQRAQRYSEIKNKINAPPINKDDQAIPKSLEHLIKLKEKVKEGKIVKKKMKKKKKDQLIVLGSHYPKLGHPNARPDKIVPVFAQRPKESGRSFLNRVNAETQAFINETTFEDKYGVEVSRNPETGRIEGLKKKEKDEIDELMRLKMKHDNTKKKKKKKNVESLPKLTKTQKRKKKVEIKKAKKIQDNIDEFKIFKDKVEFGDVVHAPPDLKIKPRKANTYESENPGKRNLLLNSLFKNSDKSTENSQSNNPINRSAKRKDLPVGERRQLEEQQKEAIIAYRKLKSQQKL